MHACRCHAIMCPLDRPLAQPPSQLPSRTPSLLALLSTDAGGYLGRLAKQGDKLAIAHLRVHVLEHVRTAHVRCMSICACA